MSLHILDRWVQGVVVRNSVGAVALVGVLIGGVGVGVYWGSLGNQPASIQPTDTGLATVPSPAPTSQAESYEERYGSNPKVQQKPGTGKTSQNSAEQPSKSLSEQAGVEDKSLSDNYREEYTRRFNGVYVPGLGTVDDIPGSTSFRLNPETGELEAETVPSSPDTRICTPGYTPCVEYQRGEDYDCAGGTGDGPHYIGGPVFVEPGWDQYRLDGDGDGVGCE